MPSIKEALKKYAFLNRPGSFIIHKSFSEMLEDIAYSSLAATGLTKETADLAYSITVKPTPDTYTTIGTKAANIPIENVQKNIVVKDDVIYGELEYLSDTGFTADIEHESLNSGNYLVLDCPEISMPGVEATIFGVADSNLNLQEYENWVKPIGPADENPDYYVVYVDDPKDKFLIIGYNNSPFGRKAISLSGLVCNKATE